MILAVTMVTYVLIQTSVPMANVQGHPSNVTQNVRFAMAMPAVRSGGSDLLMGIALVRFQVSVYIAVYFSNSNLFDCSLEWIINQGPVIIYRRGAATVCNQGCRKYLDPTF
jgi:hypothetical protein